MSSQQSPRRDVRLKGFDRRSTVEEVWEWIDRAVTDRPAAKSAERVQSLPLDAACGRILAECLISPIDVPGFDRSAMDGYALRSEETIGASQYAPCSFRVVGESLPSRPANASVGSGEAVRIMTGAPLSAGADAVVPVEMTRAAGSTNSALSDFIEVTTAVARGKNIGRRGEDVKAGQVVLAAGRCLRPQDLGVAASLGIAELRVVRRPRVALIVTGDELVPPGEPLGPFQIHEANSAMLHGLVERDGGDWHSLHRIRDDRETLRDLLAELSSAVDLVLVSGGSSVGREDHAPMLVAELGELTHHGVAMRPSSPAGAGRIGDAIVFLLPGNPVSCLCAYDFFAGRAIRWLGERSRNWPYRSEAMTVGKKIVSAVGRVDYCRIQIIDGLVEPIALTGASILTSTTKADGFVVIPAESEGLGPRSEARVFLYDG